MGLHPAIDPAAAPDPFARLAGFGPGVQLATPEGEMPVEWLATGDRLVTRDGAPAPVLWLTRRHLRREALARTPELRPVEFAAGAVGPGTPTHATTLAPATRVLLTGWKVELCAGVDNGLAKLSGLADGTAIRTPASPEGTYYTYVLLPAHAVVRANGLWTETLLLDPAARETFAGDLPPGLLDRPHLLPGHAAAGYPCLTDWEIAAIRDLDRRPEATPAPLRDVA